ncbi:hypothetical protein I79_001768 [Cricetulus griseus]|uniref:Uncharacterized protein n=1 Tax=Cricetulus griseus TaxID=10029 RepID=G3GVM4_CRIGR|nr:hypothetical protein I79_001768 [Cricetulus griseus]
MISNEKYLLCQDSQEYTRVYTHVYTSTDKLASDNQHPPSWMMDSIVYGSFIEHAVCSIITINTRTWALDEQQHPAKGYFLDE